MAQNDDSERTEDATPRRLEQARGEGHVARSQELTTFAMLMAGGGGLWFLGAGVFGELRTLVQNAMRLDVQSAFDPAQMTLRLHEQALGALWAIAPLLMVLVVVAFAAPQLLSGWLFSAEALRFDAKRLNPLSGIARMFSMRSAIELAKALAKAALVAAVAAAVIWHQREAVLQLSLLPLELGIARMCELVGMSFLMIGGTLALVAVVDVPFQLWKHSSDLKMSREDVRQEMKESEGNPQMKAAIRNQQRAMARRRMMSEVPKASVIITNPTHYAVALSYEESMRAPRVIAKGADAVAAKIREIGQQHHIPVLESPPLARALYRNAEIGDEIPETLYTAVAEILAYVFQLRRYEAHGGGLPQALPAIEVPAELDPDGAAR